MPLDMTDLPDPEDIPGLEVDVQPDTLAGDLRDAMLKRFRDLKKLWPAMTEAEQNQLAEGFGYDARRLVEEALKALTAYEFPRAIGKVATMTLNFGDKQGIQCKINFPLYDEYIRSLGSNKGKMVALVMVDSADFKGERAPAAVDKDQPDLPIDRAMQEAGDELEPDSDEEPDPAEVDAVKAEIDTEAAAFEASEAELAQQSGRSRARAQRGLAV